MEYILHNGRVEAVPEVIKGRRLADTEQEWRSRHRRVALWIFVVAESIWGFGYSFYYTFVTGDFPRGMFLPAFVGCSLFSALIAYLMYFLATRPRPDLPGVYEMGIMYPGFQGLYGNVFIPFDQINGEKRSHTRFARKMALLDIMGVARPVELRAADFGQDGVDTVKAILMQRAAPSRPVEEPRLVIYGPADRAM